MASLKLLTSSQVKMMRPILSIPAPGATKMTLEQFYVKKAKKIGESWNSGRKVFIDNPDMKLNVRMGDGSHPLDFLFVELRKNGVKAIPVTGLPDDRDLAYLNACKKINSIDNLGVCIRLKPDDLLNLKISNSAIGATLKAIGVTKEECHLLLDFGLIGDDEVAKFEGLAERAINNLTDIDLWKNFSISGIGLNMSKAVGNKVVKMSRHELNIWKGLAGKSKTLKRLPEFGDYGLINPTESFEIDFRKIKFRAKIRYTISGDWLVIKWSGSKDSKTGRSEQFREISKRLIGHAEFLGEKYSIGSKYIKDTANGTVKGSGGMGNWITATTQHHIKLVLDQFSSSGGIS